MMIRNHAAPLLAMAAVLPAMFLSALVADATGRSESPVGDPTTQDVGSYTEDVSSVDTAEGDRIGRATRGVLGSKHDFSLLTGRAIDACGACHVPHAQAIVPQTVEEGAAILEFYKIVGQREVFIPDQYTPGPTSLMCLSCHNGIVASSTVGSAHAILAGQRTGFALPDDVPQRDHPIGVPYPDGARDYRPMSMILAEGKIKLPQGRIECISCHDPHDEKRIDGMLVMSNQRSALCLACHIK